MKEITATEEEQKKVYKLMQEKNFLYEKIKKYLELYKLNTIYYVDKAGKYGFKSILKIHHLKERTKTACLSEGEAKFDVTLEFYNRYLKEFFEIAELKNFNTIQCNPITEYSMKKTLEFSEDEFKEYIQLFSLTQESINKIDKNLFNIEFLSKLELYFSKENNKFNTPLESDRNDNISEDELLLEELSNKIIKSSDNIEPLKYKLLIEKEIQKRINKDVIFCALGGGNEIGASSYFLKVDNLKFLIDCGYRIKKNSQEEYYPKLNTLYEQNLLTSKNDLTSIILTHGHLDHIGSLVATKDEFKNTPIYSSGVTKDLAYFLLNEINLTKNSEFYDSDYNLKKYEQLLLDNVIGSIYTKKIDDEIQGENYSIKFYEAGHILGARMILINVEGFKILVTGDFSDFDQSLISKYKLPEGLKVDILITESTHFDERTLLKREEQIQRLLDLVNDKSVTGNILIPAFSIGRTQEIASILNSAMKENKIEKMPIYIDGTARIVSKIYEKHGVNIFSDFIQEAPSNLVYNFQNEKSIIISSSGMLLENCKASRYTEKLISGANNAIIFTGYLSPNSKGYKLLESYNKKNAHFNIKGKKFLLKAKIANISLGAHATQTGIEELIENVNPKKVILVHNNISIKKNNIYDKLRKKFEKKEIIQSYNKLRTYL